MIGHSDFVPVPDGQSTIMQPSPDLRSGRGKDRDGLGDGDDFILATEQSDARGMPPYGGVRKPSQNQYRPLNSGNLM